ncbi:FxsA family protein [Thiospirillum jenense]|uniref:FxsA family protein n=1 Tax=Thiospirillum jenense TaxID=1653858 RepID=A0A839HJG3_9GAMM|nr:FxsA family protein [Thiospirillum jenense]MBB1127096.1 FxsA family protein [Thiospirillum jenense]
MLPLLLVLFVTAPLIELYLLIKIGAIIGPLTIILLELATAALGGYLLQRQGVSVLMRVQRLMAQGQMPALELLDGALLLIGGVALLLPGLITDVLGMILLIPPLRRLLIRRVVAQMTNTLSGMTVRHTHTRQFIETDYRREPD